MSQTAEASVEEYRKGWADGASGKGYLNDAGEGISQWYLQGHADGVNALHLAMLNIRKSFGILGTFEDPAQGLSS